MKEIQTTAYQTSDGVVHTDKQDACKHELFLICRQISRDYFVNDPKALHTAMLENADKLAPLFSEITK